MQRLATTRKPSQAAQEALVSAAAAAWRDAGMEPGDAWATYDISRHPELKAGRGMEVQWQWRDMQRRLQAEEVGSGVSAEQAAAPPLAGPGAQALAVAAAPGQSEQVRLCVHACDETICPIDRANWRGYSCLVL
jgi:hypothetical protein